MRMLWSRDLARRRRLSLPLLGALLAFQGCGLDEQEVPALSGPSELGQSLTLRAVPDFVVADNESVSVISGTLRGPNGEALAGRAILFTLADENGSPALIGELASLTGQVIAGGQSATAVTNASGVAQVRLSAPARTDILADTNVMVLARPVGDDFNAAVNRSVRVQVVPAEGRLFPPNSGNTPPLCSFVTQPAVGTGVAIAITPGFQILFQSTSSDADGRIVRYEWDFGDGTRDLKPDTNHAWGAPGLYTVIHTAVDNNGAVCVPATLSVTVR